MRATLSSALAGAASVALVAVHAAQQPAAPAPKPLVPLAASTLAADPAPYIGQHVTLMGAVEQRLSANAFTVDQDRARSTGHEVVVLTRALYGALEPHAYVTVIGEVVRLDPSDIAPRSPDYLLDVPADVMAKYRGRAAVLATSVITAAMVDIARRLPPPMTPDEEAYDKVMKRVGPAFAALRQAVAASDADAAKQQTAVLASAFGETEMFWKKRTKGDASTWAQEARKQADALAVAAAAGQWDQVKNAASLLQQACSNCHAAYRERLDDGSYRIRGDALR